MPAEIRFLLQPGSEPGQMLFHLAFAAPRADAPAFCAPAWIETGDGRRIDLGVLCAPTRFDWSAAHDRQIGQHRYASAGAFHPRLHWGEQEFAPPTPPAAGAAHAGVQAEVKAAPAEPLQLAVQVQIKGLGPAQMARLDGGSGQIQYLSGQEHGAEQRVSWTLAYAKPGEYTLSLALLDESGFWLADLHRATVSLAEPAAAMPAAMELREQSLPAPLAEVEAAAEPWLPHRYFRPAWAGIRTYTQPGGGAIARSLGSGVYLATDAETQVGDQVWYRSVSGDWAPASSLVQMIPSRLRGVELGEGEPPPPPPPPPDRRGVVTVDVLNVRARPGVSTGNPPIDRVTRNTEVDIYEEAYVAGDRWYRIGAGRWVYGRYVRLIADAPPPPPPPPTRQGVVVADSLNVRARPGVSSSNPPVDRLPRGAEVAIYEEAVVAAAVWYRIGVNRWVHSDWVRLLAAAALNPGILTTTAASALPVGWVAADVLYVRARAGVAADNPPVTEVYRNQTVAILESQTVGGAVWHRIGPERWVLGQWLRLARLRLRPAGIGSGQQWVGVSLRDQTAVAYEGDRPVYAAMIASGLPGTPTVQGIFRTWRRVPWAKMSGGSSGSYYYLEAVSWTCYFYSGYALHTAYWHDAFGSPRSHGCVNLSPYDAWWIFQWSAPGGANSPMVYVYA